VSREHSVCPLPNAITSYFQQLRTETAKRVTPTTQASVPISPITDNLAFLCALDLAMVTSRSSSSPSNGPRVHASRVLSGAIRVRDTNEFSYLSLPQTPSVLQHLIISLAAPDARPRSWHGSLFGAYTYTSSPVSSFINFLYSRISLGPSSLNSRAVSGGGCSYSTRECSAPKSAFNCAK